MFFVRCPRRDPAGAHQRPGSSPADRFVIAGPKPTTEREQYNGG